VPGRLVVVPSSDLWDEDAAQRYDESSADMFDPAVLGPTVDFLERAAGGGPALEFAVGTGRVAIPLAGRGVRVTGVELSAPMVAQLRRKVGEADLPNVIGDMVTTQVPRESSLV
jgi:ubiquinone/menaquinone biosynthesis C-methylase UbiE